MASPEILIAGAGVIGLTLALSLAREGVNVCVLSDGAPMREASSAAAGMLAVDDPDNPPELLPLSRLSRALYPRLLDDLRFHYAPAVSWQTDGTLQLLPAASATALAPLPGESLRQLLPELTPAAEERFALLAEHSLDPRELAAALIVAAARTDRLDLLAGTRVLRVREASSGIRVDSQARTFGAARFVDCTGAWSLSSQLSPGLRVHPRKGQMLTVPTPAALATHRLVLRTHEFYLVPRLHGPRRGQCVVGATVEDAGFDRSTKPEVLSALLAQASRLLPSLTDAPILDQWAGLRPATADLLPMLGALPGSDRLFVASGHYRNGILLAPGTATVMTDLLLGRTPSVDLSAFAPARFADAATTVPSL